MRFVFIVLVMLNAQTNAHLNINRKRQLAWHAFKAEYGKQYENEADEAAHERTFNNNNRLIAKHNRDYLVGKETFTMGMNCFGDLSFEEFSKYMLGNNRAFAIAQHKKRRSATLFAASNNKTVPNSVDWRSSGCVTAVSDQGFCEASWAFASTGTIEGQGCIKHNRLVSFSAQQLIDCSNGITTAAAYPYRGTSVYGICEKSIKPVYNVTEYTELNEGDENELQMATAFIGPIAVSIDASHISFQLYQSGIYEEPLCDSLNSDHDLLVTGYGTNEHGIDYWILKNSWGTTWGMEGYMYLARNQGNMCGIASNAIVPTIS